MSLRELQDAMRRSIVAHDDHDASAYIVAHGIAAPERLAVYRNTFTLTLLQALRLSYPAVERLVGAEFFDAAMRVFIAESPPASGYLDEFGGALAEFLQQFAPAASLPYLPDVARLEWAVSRALHAPDAATLELESLTALDPAQHARLRFIPHPSLGLVQTAFPADTIWRAVLDEDDAALAALDLASGPAWLVVQRGAAGVEVARLDEAVWRFTHALCARQPLGQALAEHPGSDAIATLAGLLAHGRFAGFSLATEPAPEESP